MTENIIAWRMTPIEGVCRGFTDDPNVAEKWRKAGCVVEPLVLASQPSPAATVETDEEDDASYERGFKAGYEVATGQKGPLPHLSAANAGVIRLLTKIADLVDDEDAGEPLDDAIRWANEALALLNEPQAVGGLAMLEELGK